MEQADTLLDKSDAQLLSGVEDSRVVLATTRSGNVFRAGSSSSVDIVDEGELMMLARL